MITLHVSSLTTFPLDNGIGVLRDAKYAFAEEELNGILEFEMEYDSHGVLVEELKEERIIKAKASDRLGYQLFRIYKIEKNHDADSITVFAQHITYDLAYYFVEELAVNNVSKNQVMEFISQSTSESHPFTLSSPNTSTMSSTSMYRTNPLQMVGGTQGSVLQIWGGQIERDNFNLTMLDRRGSDSGFKVTYEKNITGLNAEFDLSEVYTRFYPFYIREATDESPQEIITIDGKFIDSDLIGGYGFVRIMPLDYSSDERIDQEDSTEYIKSKMESFVEQYIEDSKPDLPKVSVEVEFAHLWETEEYKDVIVLEEVGMGDTVYVNHTVLDVEASATVNYIKYDCIAEVNEEVKLGRIKDRTSDSLTEVDDIIDRVEEAESKAQSAVISANGKNITYESPNMPTGDIKKGDLWFEVIDGDYRRTWRFDGIEWQLMLDMDSQEAKAEAEDAKDRADDAYNEAQEAVGKAQEAVGKAQEGFDKAQDALSSSNIAIGQSAEAFVEARDAFEKAQENATEIDSLALKIKSPNLIPNIAVDGSLYTSSDRWAYSASSSSGTAYGLVSFEVEDGKFRYVGVEVKQDTTYTLSWDIEEDIEFTTGTVMMIMDEYNEAVSEIFVQLTENTKLGKGEVTITTPNTSRKLIFYAILALEGEHPNVMGTDIRIKLEEGDKATPWTIHDADPYLSYTTLTATVDGLETQVRDVEGNVSTVTQLAKGTQQTVSNLQGDFTQVSTTVDGLQSEVTKKVDNTTYNSKMTQLDNAINSKVSQTDADNKYATQTQLTQTSDKITSRVEEIEGWEFGGRNLILDSEESIIKYGYLVNEYELSTDLVEGQKYTISITGMFLTNEKPDSRFGVWMNRGSYRLGDMKVVNDEGQIHSLTFEAIKPSSGNESKIRIYQLPNRELSKVVISHAKLEKGNVRTDWSPAPEDTDQKFSAIDQTIDSIATRVQTNADNYSSMSQTVLGFQTTVSNMEGDLNTVTNLANANQQSITNVDGKVNTLTQTVDTTVSRIENGVTNLVTHDANKWETGSISNTGGGNTASSDSQYLRLIDYYPIESNREYTLTTYAGLLNGYETSYRINIYYYDATKNFIEFRSVSFNTPVTVTTPTNAKYYRIRVSNFEMGGLPWFIEPNFMGSAIRIKLQRGAYSTDWTNHDSDVYSQYSQLQDAINLRVTKDDLINQINIVTSGVLISGKKLVLDGDTTVTGNFRVRDANIASIEAGKVVGGEADFAKFSAININANSINSGTLSTDVMRVRGGSTTEYALIDGSEITTRGKHVRTWFGDTATHDVGIQLRYGRLRFHNYDSKRNLYFSDLGISTYYGGSDGEDGGNQGSGTIEFFSYRHNSVIRGLTVYSNNGVVALESEQRNIVIAPRYSSYANGRKFSFDAKAVTNEGYITYGKSGIRFSEGQTSGDPIIHATNSDGDLASGSFYAQSFYGDLKPRGSYAYVRAPRLRIINHDSATTSNFGDLEGQQFMAGSIRLNLQLGNDDFYIGTSSGEVRITNNLLWQGSHASTTYRPVRARSFIESSSRTLKTDIKVYEDSAMDVIRSLTVVNYRFKDDVERGVILRQIGFISEDSPAIATADNMAIQTTRLASYLTKGIQELDLKIDLTREELVLKIADLESRLNVSEQKIKELESAA